MLVDDIDYILKNDLTKLASESYVRKLSFEQKLTDFSLECKVYATEIRDELKKIREKITKYCSLPSDDKTLETIKETNEFIIDLVNSFDIVYN